MSEKLNKKMLQRSEHNGMIDGWKLRIWHRKKKGSKCAHFLVKCGCCNEKVKIYYDDHTLEINGVQAPKEEWEKFFKKVFKLVGIKIVGEEK